MTSPQSSPRTTSPRIPRVFHRIWLGGRMPQKYVAYGETWREHHPAWEMRTWTEQDLPLLRNQVAFDRAATYAQKADIARYELLHRFGGVYVDTDFECLKPIDDLIAGHHSFTASEDGVWASIGILGCCPGDPCFAELVEQLPRSLAQEPDAPVNVQTGPIFFTRVLQARSSRGESIPEIFAPHVFYPLTWDDPEQDRNDFPESYGVHHWGASWVPTQRAVVTGVEGAARTGDRREPRVRVSVGIQPEPTMPSLQVLASALLAFRSDDDVEITVAVRGEPGPDVAEAVRGLCTSIAGDGRLPHVVVRSLADARDLAAHVSFLDHDHDDSAWGQAGRAILEIGAAAAALVPRPSASADAPASGTTSPAPAPATASVPAPSHSAVYVGDDRLLIRTVWGGRLLVSASDMSLTPDLVFDGGYDPGLTAFLMRTLVPGGRCVDVGANVGLFTVLMAHLVGPHGHVDAFEVSPGVVSLLRDNVALNYLNDRVEVHEVAAYDRRASLVFHATGRFQGNGSLREHSSGYRDMYRVDSFATVDVQADRLDAILGDGLVDLVKVDVEGGELAALRGLAGLVQSRRVSTVVFEFVRSLIGTEWDELIELLAAWRTDGWRFCSISVDGQLVPLDFTEMVRVGNYTSVVMAR